MLRDEGRTLGPVLDFELVFAFNQHLADIDFQMVLANPYLSQWYFWTLLKFVR